MLNCIMILLITCEVLSLNSILPKYYDVSLRKCDGSFSVEIGRTSFNTSTPEFIGEFRNLSMIQCRWICSREKINCWMIEYFNNNNCRLFSKVSFFLSQRNSRIDSWLCADTIMCANMEGRCNGYWVGYDYFKVTDSLNFPLKTISNILIHECQNNCEYTKMCGSINFQCQQNSCSYSKGNCTLMYGYIPYLAKIIPKDHFNKALTWRCCTNQHIFQNDYCRNNVNGIAKETLKGKWKIQNSNNTILRSYHYYVNFLTLDMEVCIDTCSNDPFCMIPIYINGSIPKCYLALNSEVGNFKEILNLEEILKYEYYTIWKWENLGCESYHSYNDTEKRKQCFCFQKNMTTTIKNIKCTDFVYIFDNMTLNLYAEDDKRSFYLNDGKNTFEIDHSLRNQFRLCHIFNCHFYNAMVNSEFKKINIVPRNEWFAKEPLEINLLTHPVEYVIILNTFRPNGRCFSKEICSEFVRDFQLFQFHTLGFSDIGYNFLIAEDGNIYEGRGWSNVGAHTKGYNTKSIGVAFIGWFENVYPNEISLLALRNLITYGIEKQYLIENVFIKSNRDFRPNEIPGKLLKDIIDNWNVKNLTLVNKCLAISVYNLELAKYLTSAFCIFFFFVILYFIISYFHHKKQFCKIILNRINNKNWKYECIYNNVNFNLFENINIQKDWIYICEENKLKDNCSCISEIEILWNYCMISAEICFMYRLNNLLHSMIYKNHISVFILKSQSNISPKHIFLFHLTPENEFFSKLLFKGNRLCDICICKRYKIRQYPPSSHKVFFRCYNSFLRNLQIIITKDNDNNILMMKNIEITI